MPSRTSGLSLVFLPLCFLSQADFGFWTLDGVRQEDAWGIALRQFAFVVHTNDREAVAWRYAGDTDGDAVNDGVEYFYYGGLTNGAASDSDGDGLTLINDPHPRFGQSSLAGGVFWADSALVAANLQLFDRVTSIMVDGLVAPYFSSWGTNAPQNVVLPNAHPALGDWDGDGDLDLVVGGSPGQVRQFENKGSPVVLNLTEHSSNFVDVASHWAGILNPAPALGDFNCDGFDDLAIGGSTNVLRLIESWGTYAGHSVSAVLFQTAALTSAVPAFADLDADGWDDLLVLTEQGLVQSYSNTHAALNPFAPTPTVTDLLGTRVPNARGLSAADINDDGRLDILVSDDKGNIWEFWGISFP